MLPSRGQHTTAPARAAAGDALVIVRRNQRHRVGFFDVRTQFGEHLVVRNADGHRDAELLPDAPANDLREAVGIRHVRRGRGDVDPVFVEPKRLHPVGILAIDRAAQRGKFLICVIVRLDRNQQRAFLLGLPDGLARLDAKLFRRLVFGEDDAVPRLGIARNGDGVRTERGVEHATEA